MIKGKRKIRSNVIFIIILHFPHPSSNLTIFILFSFSCCCWFLRYFSNRFLISFTVLLVSFLFVGCDFVFALTGNPKPQTTKLTLKLYVHWLTVGKTKNKNIAHKIVINSHMNQPNVGKKNNKEQFYDIFIWLSFLFDMRSSNGMMRMCYCNCK